MLAALSARAPARRDVVLAFGLAILLFAIARFGDRANTTAEALGAAALCLPLAWRRRWPLEVLIVVAGGGLLYLGLGRATNNFIAPLMVALYTVISAGGSRQRTLAVAGVTLLYAIFI